MDLKMTDPIKRIRINHCVLYEDIHLDLWRAEKKPDRLFHVTGGIYGNILRIHPPLADDDLNRMQRWGGLAFLKWLLRKKI